MFYILENNAPMVDAEGNKLAYLSKDEALDVIGYFSTTQGYKVVNMLDFLLGEDF